MGTDNQQVGSFKYHSDNEAFARKGLVLNLPQSLGQLNLVFLV